MTSEHATLHEQILTALHQQPVGVDDLLKHLSTGADDTPCFLLGRNADARRLRHQFKFDGVIDDYAQSGLDWEGLPILKMKEVPPEAVVVNCVSSIAPVNAQKALREAGLNKVINLADLVASGTLEPKDWPEFMRTQRVDYQAHSTAWQNLFDRLEDEESKQTLLDVLRFRLTANSQYMQHYPVRLVDQYFENFLNLSDEVFVDAGGFDGDTTEQFCLRVPNYQRVYLFEPSAINLAAARKRLAGRRDIEFRAVGLSDQAGELRFDSESGSASAINNEGGERIAVTTLDENVQEPVGFIKMDLEGWELHALRGCEKQIAAHAPKLAISVYHHAAHFREVLNYVLNLQPAYKVRLRHYTQGWSETVMFFTSE